LYYTNIRLSRYDHGSFNSLRTPEGILVLLTPWRAAATGRTRDRLSWRRSELRNVR